MSERAESGESCEESGRERGKTSSNSLTNFKYVLIDLLIFDLDLQYELIDRPYSLELGFVDKFGSP